MRASLGPYEILDLLGAGGMGEVYRARDPRLGRVVAVKVLPSSFSADARRLRRFEQEARAAGMLNHPNVLAIYDVGTHEGSPYLVTELLEGETLRARLSAGPIPLSKVFDYGVQTAMGLAAAHEKGIVHRDLKPENLFVTRDGRVKILDFGLAKLASPEREERSDAPTTPRDTDPGVVMGTVGYMSPEQVRGLEADARSDLFAAGAILYEMLTGRRAFHRNTNVETMNAILSEDPKEPADAGREIPPGAMRLVRRCLEKRPEERFQSARDLGFALEALSGTSGASVVAPSVTRRIPERYAWMVAGAFAISSLALGIAHLREPAPDRPAYQFAVFPPPGATLGATADEGFALSPDGRHLVFAATDTTGTRRLALRSLHSPEARALPGTEGASHPFWSPESRFVGFISSGKLKKIAIEGGPPQTLCDAGEDRGGTWNRDGVILFAPISGGPLYRVSADGGKATPLTMLDSSREENAHRWPLFLPDGRHFLYVVRSSNPEHTGIYVRSLDSNESRRLVSVYSSAAFSPPYLLYVRGDTLTAQVFDVSSLELSGEPFLVLEKVGSVAAFGKGHFSASVDGTLAYRTNRSDYELPVWFEREGKQVGALGPPQDYGYPSLSPDETHVVFERNDPQTGTPDIWLLDLSRGTSSRFTSHPAGEYWPTWSPDGSQVVFSSNRSGGGTDLFQKMASGDGEEVLLRPGATVFATDWSADGRFIVYQALDPETNYDLWALPLDGERKPIVLVQTAFSETIGRLSPDGRWLAYTSDESGRPEVYVRPFLRPGGSQLITTDGGNWPHWRGDGKEIVFSSPERRLMSVSVESDSSAFRASVPRALFDEPVVGNYFTVSRDGQRFLVNTVLPEAKAPIQIFVNWTPERR